MLDLDFMLHVLRDVGTKRKSIHLRHVYLDLMHRLTTNLLQLPKLQSMHVNKLIICKASQFECKGFTLLKWFGTCHLLSFIR